MPVLDVIVKGPSTLAPFQLPRERAPSSKVVVDAIPSRTRK